ncbi:hypothetical protein Bca52824_083166 [Brassica carinata]|uniref:Uncharacterized protein n=1 Tax=Brassica carinata TaxID=52824 RepID=A0A8X7PKU6_BRACI|nr:hypothetical protein Bca52824_083166 [Brassica carinata]
MEFSAADFEKLVMFEHARKACEAQYVKGHLDSCFFDSFVVQNFLQWGGALLELAQFQPIPEAKLMLDGISFFLQIIMLMQQSLGGGGGGGGPEASSNASKKNNGFTYDVCGWIIIACGIVAGFSDLEDFWARRLPDDFQEVL